MIVLCFIGATAITIMWGLAAFQAYKNYEASKRK